MSPRFKTDKEIPHGYLPDYLELIRRIGPAAVICEIGVCRGESLDMWRELCPQGTVIGVDHDPGSHWPEGTHWIVAGQDHPDLPAMIREHAPGGCDLIVDDASHVGRLTRMTFARLWPLVRPGGFYVIEDWADPWVNPGWGVADPADTLVSYVPELIRVLRDGASEVRYTREGLAIIRRSP